MASLLVLSAGCGVSAGTDAGDTVDAATEDSGEPASDAGLQPDAGDAGAPPDAGGDGGAILIDAGVPDAGPSDAGSDAGPPDAGVPDAGLPDAGPPDAGSCPMSAPTCHSLTQVGDLVADTYVPEEPPVATGGSIEPGLYMLTDSSTYTGIGGATGPMGSAQWVTVQVNTTNAGLTADLLNTHMDCGEQRMSFAIQIADTELVTTALCPADCTDCGGTSPFSATETSLSIFRIDGEGTSVQTFERLQLRPAPSR